MFWILLINIKYRYFHTIDILYTLEFLIFDIFDMWFTLSIYLLSKKKKEHKGCHTCYNVALPHNAKFSLFLTLFPVYHFMVRYTADSVTAAVWGGGGGGSKSLWPPLYREHWPDGPRGPARYTSAEPEVRYSKPEVRSTYHIKIKSMIYKKILLFLNHQRG